MSDATCSGGVGLFSLLGLLFVGLKLGHVIDWRWIWVLAPFWAPLLAVVLISTVAMCVIAVVSACTAPRHGHRRWR